MIRTPRRSPRTDSRVPCTTFVRSVLCLADRDIVVVTRLRHARDIVVADLGDGRVRIAGRTGLVDGSVIAQAVLRDDRVRGERRTGSENRRDRNPREKYFLHYGYLPPFTEFSETSAPCRGAGPITYWLTTAVLPVPFWVTIESLPSLSWLTVAELPLPPCVISESLPLPTWVSEAKPSIPDWVIEDVLLLPC